MRYSLPRRIDDEVCDTMATKQIGKLKLHCSKRGVAFKWGDNPAHRLSFERKKAADDASVDSSGYAGDAYAPDGYDQGAYNAANAAPGYDQGDGGYDGGYYEEGHDSAKYGALYSSDWLMYLLLVVFPPLGIWILWKRERFEQPVRIGISIVSAIWFIVLLIWLFSALFGGGGSDTIRQGQTVQPTVISTPAPAVVATPAPAIGDDTTIAPPAATPKASTGGSTGGNTTNTGNTTGDTGDDGTSGTDSAGTTYVYASNTGAYYHKTNTCENLEEGASRVALNIARSRSQTACPVCYPEGGTGTTYYVTKGGKYYHKNATCTNMKNATAITLAQAKKQGYKVCPTCIGAYYATKTGKWYHVKSNCQGMTGAVHITKKAAVAAGKKACPVCITKKAASASTTKSSSSSSTSAAKKTYYATKSGKYYHVNNTCGGMKNATKISLATAKKYGKTACPTCIKKAATTKAANAATYYATASGNYYHKAKTCARLKGIKAADIKKITKATATKYGKTACPTCLAAQVTSYVYSATGGTYYHKTSTCSGMKNARRITLAAAKKKGQTACPVCYKAQAAKGTYYYTSAATKYYHKNTVCSGTKNATQVTLATAKARGKTACPICVLNNVKRYYATKANKYYHLKKNCSGMIGASKVTLSAAKKAGKTACPICVQGVKITPTPTPSPKIYCFAASGSKYYHKNRFCSGIKNAKKVQLSVARNKGKTACPICVTKTVKQGNLTTNAADKNTACYASGSSAYYHSNRSCVLGLSKTTVYAAKRKGKVACPVCGKGLHTYVYVTRNGAKYHRKSTCGGTINAYKVSLATAVSKNYIRCARCNAPRKSLAK